MTIFTLVSNQLSRPFKAGALVFGAIFCFLALSMATSQVLAEAVPAAPLQAASALKRSTSPAALPKTSSAPGKSSQPSWQELTPEQQLSLRPLAAHWSSLNSARKRKWIAFAANYSALTPAEQAKLHSRMTEWASLSQKQRDQARLNFAQTKQLSPTQKAATWQAYQALSPEEKQKLAKSAPPKPTGAATATKPVAPGQLTKIPLTKQAKRQVSEVPAINQAVNRKTLLPPAKPLPEPKPTQQN